MRSRAYRIVSAALVFMAACLVLGTAWLLRTYGLLSPDEIAFHLNVRVGGANDVYIATIIETVLLPALLAGALFFVLETCGLFGWQPRWLRPAWRALHWLRVHCLPLCALCAAGALTYGLFALELPDYFFRQSKDDPFIQTHYTLGNPIAPENKRNLIYIFLESMETTFYSAQEGGAQADDLIPELHALAAENLTFSDRDDLSGGAVAASGATWTVGAMTAHSGGLPLKLPFDNLNSYGDFATFLPGAVLLGDLLAQQGYNQTLLLGSQAYFGGRDHLYTQHGGFNIVDYTSLMAQGRLPEDYWVWWGYEDEKLFAFAKEQLTSLAAADAPFHFAMLTADTHEPSGYVCELCAQEYDNQYANVLRCSSRQVYGFVRWIQAQPFYQNTTIVLAGDHLSMDGSFFTALPESYDRRVYVCYINPVIQPPTTRRGYTTMDLYPTTLAALGWQLPGDRLGLGVSLFGDTPTLIETYGAQALDDHLESGSAFYNKRLLYSD